MSYLVAFSISLFLSFACLANVERFCTTSKLVGKNARAYDFKTKNLPCVDQVDCWVQFKAPEDTASEITSTMPVSSSWLR